MLFGMLSRSEDKKKEAEKLRQVVIFGDSHCNRYNVGNQLPEVLPALKQIDLKLNAISGASILGVGKRNSTLGVHDKIESMLTGEEDAVVFNFGQVDVELGYYYRLVVKGEEVAYEAFVARLIETYMAALKSFVKPQSFVIVKGINPSVLTYHRGRAVQYTSRIITENITDADLKKQYMKKLNGVFPDADELDRRHFYFNRELSRACGREGYDYYDINDYLCDPGTGRVRTEFVPQAFDHHVPATIGVHAAYWRPVIMLLAQRAAAKAG